ncbi:MAG: TetR/AcrR family transcriptional regulator [Actinomycetota bacterium]|nr:TetR/AcrR family transcriptional regulator [Actinomycetota bacterium]
MTAQPSPARGAPPAARTPRARRSDGEETRRRVLDAAVASILELGYYETSTNEIARRAGVTWGALQYQFGTREALLLEVVNDRWDRLQALVASARIEGRTLEERLSSLMNVLAEHYGREEELAQIQILLDLTRNPKVSGPTRQAVAEHGRKLLKAWRPLFEQALDQAAGEEDLVRYAFNALRGFLLGGLISAGVAGPRRDRSSGKMLVDGVAAVVRAEAAARHIRVE